jgi:glycosyltransferase involved in cell wall biosynthesis
MKNHEHRVSIGLPVYNGEKYLRESVESILAQTYPDFELIISDNASTDTTELTCWEYAKSDPRVRYLRNDTNLGAAPNFNKVFDLSAGEYFKWAAHDDVLAPEFLSRCVDVLDQNQDVVLCYTRVKIIDENSAFEVDYNPGPDTNSPRSSERFRNLILRPEYAVQQMGLIRANVLRKTVGHGSYPSSDEVLLAELGLMGRFYEVPERLFFYRRHPEQVARILDQRSRVPFFDTSMQDKIVLPKWLYLFACIKAIRHVDLSLRDRLNCYLTMGYWMLMPANSRALGKDVLLAIGKLVNRGRVKSRTEEQPL